MKKAALLFVSVAILFFSSCYNIPIQSYILTIKDNGVYQDDRTQHIIVIDALGSFDDIRYTLDGTEPDQSSPIYSPSSYTATDLKNYDGILVTEGLTIKAVAFNGEEHTFPGEADISFTPWSVDIVDNGPSYDDTSKHIISITDSIWKGDIFYALNGSAPSEQAERYTPFQYKGSNGKTYEGILVAEGTAINAISIKTAAGNKRLSEVTTKTVRIAEWPIEIIDNGQYFGDGSKHIITITDSEKKGDIFYTTKGVPSSSSTEYAPSRYKANDGNEYEGILVGEGNMLKAVSYVEINGIQGESRIAEKSVDVYQWGITLIDNGAYKNDTTKHIVTLKDTEKSGKIYYSTTRIPDSGTIEYVPKSYTGRDGHSYEGILIGEFENLRAISYATENGTAKSSFIFSETINIAEWPIEIVDNGQYWGDGSKHVITINDSEKQGEIYYTTKGVPSSSSIKYAPSRYKANDGKVYSGVLVGEGETVNAISYITMYGFSGKSCTCQKNVEVYQWRISIVDYGPQNIDSGKHIISIKDTEKSGDIYFSTTETIPKSTSSRYTESEYTGKDGAVHNGILIDEGQTVSAISYITENGTVKSSSVAVKTVEIPAWNIQIVDYGQLYDYGSKHIISIIDEERYGTIYYTTDGRTPNTSSDVYSPSIYLSADGKEYNGVLVEEGKSVKAVSYISIGYVSGTSTMAEEKVETYLWKIEIINNGSYAKDTSKNIITIADSVNSGTIYYSEDESYPTIFKNKYIPASYTGEDGKTYEGILVSRGIPIKAISYMEVDGKLRSSSIVSIEVKKYKVGEKGPAGGYVFYDKGSYSDGWRYMEVGPRELEACQFGGYEMYAGTSTEVGSGKANTEAIIKAYGGWAARACADYTCNGYNDWFLPSKDELNLVYENIHKKNIGNYSGSFWSSSEYGAYNAWAQVICNTYIPDGYQWYDAVYYGKRVLPVRAF